MADRLKGKVAVVTGAAPRGEGVGNGMATARSCSHAKGAKVVLVNRSAERAEKLAKQITRRGRRGVGVRRRRDRADGGRGDGRLRRQDATAGSTSCTTMSASARPGTPETVTLADWHKVLEANLTTHDAVHEVLPARG